MTGPRLPPLNAIRVFVSAARHCSFKQAAEELRVTPGAISRQIRALETFFSTRLFERGTRGVRLTDQGARYFARVADLMTELAGATEELTLAKPKPVVQVDSVPTLTMHWLLPRLPAFRQAQPGIEVSLRTSMGPVDLSSRFDLAIRRDPTHFSGLRPTRLMHEECLLVGSPALLGRARIKRPRDLTRFTAIHIRAREDLWPTWTVAQGLLDSDFAEKLVVDQTFFAIQAAEDGLGVAVIPTLFVARQLGSGRLVAPLGHDRTVSGAYYLLEPQRRLSLETQRFRDWLIRLARREGATGGRAVNPGMS